MSNYPYSLRNTKPFKKINCPSCGKREFTLYINNMAMEPLADHVGKCDRDLNCKYHYTPKQYFEEKGIVPFRTQYRAPESLEAKPVSYIDSDVLKKSLGNESENKLVQYLLSKFRKDPVEQVIAMYYIGTSPYWQGSTIFWQVDRSGGIRTGKIMLYNEQTGRRVKKDGRSKIAWVHKTPNSSNFNLSQCFFGDHLLTDNEKIVGVVESEKTALIASLCLPEICWIACGAKGHLNDELLSSLKGFDVMLYPDLGAYDSWKKKADRYGFEVSNILEEAATPEDRAAGCDLADYLLRNIPEEVRVIEEHNAGEQVTPEASSCPPTKPLVHSTDIGASHMMKAPVQGPTALKNFIHRGDDWTKQTNALETFFKSVELPTGPVKLDSATTITNLPGFIDSHFQMVKHNNRNNTFLPYLERLYLVKQLIET